jgi:cytochrome b6-f complex iron-sulfur subunit
MALSLTRPAVAGPGLVRPTRRWLLRAAVLGGLTAVAAQATGCFVHFYYPRRVGAFGGKVLAGKPEDVKLGELRYVREGKFYLSRVPDGLLALYQRCPHLGCVVPWRPDDPSEDALGSTGRFNCPCHQSIYDRYGVVKSGPAPRPMDLMQVSIENGAVVVDSRQVVRRAGYEPGQAVPV